MIIAKVTKRSVSTVQDKLYTITNNLTLMENSIEVLNKDYDVLYRPGEDIAISEKQFIVLMQKDIDRYKASQTIFKDTKFDASIINISKGLSL